MRTRIIMFMISTGLRTVPERTSDGRISEHGELGTDPPRHATRAERCAGLPAHSVHTRRRVPNRKKKNPAPADSPIGAHSRQPTKQNMTDPRRATCMWYRLQCNRSTCAHAIVLVFPWWTARISRRTWRSTCHRRHRWRRLGHTWRRNGRVPVGRVTG